MSEELSHARTIINAWMTRCSSSATVNVKGQAVLDLFSEFEGPVGESRKLFSQSNSWVNPPPLTPRYPPGRPDPSDASDPSAQTSIAPATRRGMSPGAYPGDVVTFASHLPVRGRERRQQPVSLSQE